MSKGEKIDIHLTREREARELLVNLQGDATIYAQLLMQLAQRLSQLARESAASLCKLNELDMVLDVDTRKMLNSYPSKETVNDVLTGMITAAGTLEAARAELKKFGVVPAE